MPLPLGPIVFQDVPPVLAVVWYLFYAAIAAWVTLDARARGLRWGVWLLLALIIGPVAWLLYLTVFRPRDRSAGIDIGAGEGSE